MTIDTLKYSQDLETAGESPPVAQAHAHALKEAFDDHVVTKDYLHAEMARQTVDIAAMFEDMRKDMENRFEGMRKDMENRFEGIDKRLTRIDTLLYVIVPIAIGSIPALMKFYL